MPPKRLVRAATRPRVARRALEVTALANSPQSKPGDSNEDLLLRVTPPRVPRDLSTRSHLLSTAEPLRDRPVIVVQAPAGFGKTSLLAQWRLEHLARGAVVAWLSAQRRDEPQRLLQALVLAMRVGAGRPAFGLTLLEASAPGGLEAATVLLAEVGQLALDTVLMIDEADRLPEASLEVLAYLVRNAPSNLRVVIAARAECNLAIEDLVDYGQCLLLGPTMLSFQLEETLRLVRSRAGRIDSDAAAQLHDLTEGWPLGLQLALSIIAAGKDDARAAISAMAAEGGALRERLVGLMLAKLDPEDGRFLERVAILDDLHPDLCTALIGADAAQRLRRLARETPVFTSAEQGNWIRMHALARDALRVRFATLPAAEQVELHLRAADWLETNGLVGAAAKHALAAGRRDKAYDLAERSLYDALRTRGRQGAVLEWLARLPADELDRRPRLLLAAAWSLALSERHAEAGGLVERLLAQPHVDDALRCECALISSGAAVYADDPDRFAVLHDPWRNNPPLHDPVLLHVYANRSALRALLDGDPSLARLHVQHAPHGDSGQALVYVRRWGELFVGMAYLWEGQVKLTENLLQPTLVAAEGELGRRSPLSCMLASLLAAAVWELDRAGDAAALLANRIDVLEHRGLPEMLLLAYRTLARIAVAEGAEHRATEVLEAMHAVGVHRGMPRLCIASLAEQVRMHARRFRSQTCRDLCGRIDTVLADPATPTGRIWRRSVEALRELARGHAAIAAQDWRGAIELLGRAEAAGRAMNLGRIVVEIMALRAWALDQVGEQSLALLREAADLADSRGLARVFMDVHPVLGDWASTVLREGAAPVGSRPGPLAAPMRAPPASVPAAPRSMPSTALTPKEREVLELLARNLTNKEIGLALQVGEQTVKWHLKNLFAKLDAASRKHLVLRARILGLLEPAA
jgi:LuxR family maltose regulon positive regulatory protein